MSEEGNAALFRIFGVLNEAALEPMAWVDIGFILQMVGLSKTDPAMASMIIAGLPELMPEHVETFRLACNGLPGPVNGGLH
jgi:hypothetical protein